MARFVLFSVGLAAVLALGCGNGREPGASGGSPPSPDPAALLGEGALGGATAERNLFENALRAILDPLPEGRRPGPEGWDPITRAKAAAWLKENRVGKLSEIHLPIEKAEVEVVNERAGQYKVTVTVVPYVTRVVVNDVPWRIRVTFVDESESWRFWWSDVDEDFARLVSGAGGMSFSCRVIEAAFVDASDDAMPMSADAGRTVVSDARLRLVVRPVSAAPVVDRQFNLSVERTLGRRIESERDRPEAWLARSEVRRSLGMHHGAFADSLEAASLNPDAALPYGHAAYLLAVSWRPGVTDGALAVRLAHKYVELCGSENADSVLVLALLRAGDFDGAMTRLAFYVKRHRKELPEYVAAAKRREPWTEPRPVMALPEDPARDDDAFRRNKARFAELADQVTPAQEHVRLLRSLRSTLSVIVDLERSKMAATERRRDTVSFEHESPLVKRLMSGTPFDLRSGSDVKQGEALLEEHTSKILKVLEAAEHLYAGATALPMQPMRREDVNASWWELRDCVDALKMFLADAGAPYPESLSRDGAAVAGRLERLKAFLESEYPSVLADAKARSQSR
jgi:hypothetical protein